MLRAPLLAVLLVLGACSGTKPSLPLTFALPGEEPEGEVRSQRVLLIADNQEHFLYGDPVWLRRGLFDKVIGAAIRSPDLDLYGEDLLRWILENADQNKTMPIHLGDALNVSCTVEMDHFEQHMKKSRKAWFMLPGNHDGFFYGTSGGSVKTVPRGTSNEEWLKACRNGGGPLTTAGFIRRYLKALATQPDAGARAFAPLAGRAAGNFSYSGSERAVLRRVAWRTYADDGPFWQSYLIQELDITLNVPDNPRRVRLILLDTSQYQVSPGLLGHVIPGMYDAGSTGQMLDDQFSVLESWLASDRRDDADIFVLGHHPQDALASDTRERFEALREKYGVELYVSAHTHSGSYRVFEHAEAAQLELNVGSTLDWPAQFRTFEVGDATQAGERRVFIRSPRFELARLWQARTAPDLPQYPDCAKNEEAWYPLEGRNNRYITYMDDNSAASSVPMQRKIMTSLLAAYTRLLTIAPTAAAAAWPAGTSNDETLLARIAELSKPSAKLQEQEALLRALETFESSRIATDETLHRQYRLCQALWSSRTDNQRQRRPEEDQWFVVFPTKRKAE